jgi:hypothetical protein
MLEAADKAVYLPMTGFVESMNVGVATALVMQRLFDLCPEAKGDLGVVQKAVLRRHWYGQLARNPQQRRVFSQCADRLNAAAAVRSATADE